MDNSNNIVFNLKTSTQKDTVFLLGVMLINVYLSNKKDNLNAKEDNTFKLTVIDVFEKIYHHQQNWAEKYMEMGKRLVSMNQYMSFYEIVVDAIQNGLRGITKDETVTIWKLVEYISTFLPFVIKGGRYDYISDMRDIIIDVLRTEGMILN